MGAHAYWYFENYSGDVEESLQALREREFKAGRYNPVTPFPDFPPGPDSPSPGAQHNSIEEIMADAAEAEQDRFSICFASPIFQITVPSLHYRMTNWNRCTERISQPVPWSSRTWTFWKMLNVAKGFTLFSTTTNSPTRFILRDTRSTSRSIPKINTRLAANACRIEFENALFLANHRNSIFYS